MIVGNARVAMTVSILMMHSTMHDMRSLAKAALSIAANIAALFVRFSFPKKYDWRWKWRMLSGRYEPETTRLLKRIIRRGMVVVDAGAHIGYFTRLFSRRVGSRGQVFAFEPDEENLRHLRNNVARMSNVEINTDALSSKVGTISFYHVEGSTGCHTTIANNAPGTPARQVRATTLDAFVENNSIGKVDLIKMDIEGGEWDALEGMERTLRKDSPFVVCEYNPSALAHSGKSPEKFFDIFAWHGYRIYVVATQGLTELREPYAEHLRTHLGADTSINIFCKKE